MMPILQRNPTIKDRMVRGLISLQQAMSLTILVLSVKKSIHCMSVVNSSPSIVTEDLSVSKSNSLCLNCLGSGHCTKNCWSVNHCQKCQRLHHTLLIQPQEITVNSQQSMSSNSSNAQLPYIECVETASYAAATKLVQTFY